MNCRGIALVSSFEMRHLLVLFTFILFRHGASLTPATAPNPDRFVEIRAVNPTAIAPLMSLRSTGIVARTPVLAVQNAIFCGTSVEKSAECASDRLDAEASLVHAALWRVLGEEKFMRSALIFLDMFTQSFVGYSGRLGRRHAGGLSLVCFNLYMPNPTVEYHA